MIPERILNDPSWCVSDNKIPLDVFALKKGLKWGASDKRSHSSYVDHKEAVEIGIKHNMPVTLLVDSNKHNIYMLDIEKTCPQEIRQAILLSLQNSILYLERSLSGKGFHAMISLPAPAELKTVKYKKWFEILTGHHCTFTSDTVDFNTAFYDDFDTNEVITDDDKDVELLEALKEPIAAMNFYDLICKNGGRTSLVVESSSFDTYKRAAAGYDGRHADLFGMLCDMLYLKTVDDFYGDYSSYEFGYASKLHYALRRYAENMIDCNCRNYKLPMNREESIMLVFMVLKQILPPRQKHSEIRNGLPWLLYTSERVYDKSFTQQPAQKE